MGDEMNNDDDNLPLTINIAADQWAFTCRRLKYLEAVIIQILRDAKRLKEWFSAAELAAFRLRGLPRSSARLWRFRDASGNGGARREYHCTALPEPAFADLLDRIMLPPGTASAGGQHASPEIPLPQTPKAAPPDNAAPPWMLPLMRSLRGGRLLTVREAVEALPAALPPGVTCPTCEEAETVLRRFGFTV
jgi:hypothetical protein